MAQTPARGELVIALLLWCLPGNEVFDDENRAHVEVARYVNGNPKMVLHKLIWMAENGWVTLNRDHPSVKPPEIKTIELAAEGKFAVAQLVERMLYDKGDCLRLFRRYYHANRPIDPRTKVPVLSAHDLVSSEIDSEERRRENRERIRNELDGFANGAWRSLAA